MPSPMRVLLARGRPLALVLSALVFAFLLCAALVPGAPSLRSSTISLETWQDLIHSHKGFYQKSFKPFAPLRPSGSLSDDDLANTLHVLSANFAFADMTINYLCKAARFAPLDYIVVAQDARFHLLLKSLSIPSVDITALGLPELPSFKTGYGSETYRLVTEGKMLAVREILKAGVHVFFADVDLVLNRNPLPDIRGDTDFMFQADWAATRYHEPDDMQARQSPCTGFYYMKSNAKTLAFLDRVIARFEIIMPGPNNNDQSALRKELETMRNADEAHYIRNDRNFSQEILNDSVMTYSSFPYVSYPPGWAWIRNREKYEKLVMAAGASMDPVSAHANFVAGHDDKVRELRLRDYWEVQDDAFAKYVSSFTRTLDATGDGSTHATHWSSFCGGDKGDEVDDEAPSDESIEL